MVAPGLRPEAVRDHLAGRGVVARLGWYRSSEHLVSVTVAVDAAGRVATTPPRRGGVVPGVVLEELVHDLQETFGADVLIGAARTDAGEQPTASVAAEREEWPGHDARTVVVTPLTDHALRPYADRLGRPLAVLDLGARRAVMTAGPGRELGVHGWPEDAYPVLRLQVDGEDRTALLALGPEEVVLCSWEMRSVVVHGAVDEPGPALAAMAEDVLGDREDAAAFAAVFGADTEEVLAAMGSPSAAGFAAFARALGLPGAVVDVLEGRLAPQGVPGAAVHRPAGVGRTVGPAAGRRLTGVGRLGGGFGRAYAQLVRERPRLVRGVGAAEAAAGTVLLGRVLRAPRGGRRRLAAALAAGLLLDGVAGLVLARLLRRVR